MASVSSAVAPSKTIRPSFKPTTRSAYSRVSSRVCKLTSAVMPSSRQTRLRISSTTRDSFGIEARHRLVGQDNRRLLHQGSRDGDALLFAAGQFVGALVGVIEQADTLQVNQRAAALVLGKNPQRTAPSRLITQARRRARCR